MSRIRSERKTWLALAAALCLAGIAACDDEGGDSGGPADVVDDGTGADTSVDVPEDTIPYETLSQYALFEGNGASQQPAAGVIPYDVAMQLFADEAAKFRFIALPEGGRIDYAPDAHWVLPVGTILVKTFAYYADARDPDQGFRLVETRLIIHGEDGWTPHTYLWNDEQTEAFEATVGARVPVTWIDDAGESHSLDYRVPNTNQCLRCHGDGAEPLGPHTRQMNRLNTYAGEAVNQIDHLEDLGLFSAEIPPAGERAAFPAIDDEGVDVETRARAYLDANCSHCHSATGVASSTGLNLSHTTTNPIDYGVCRQPFAAGPGTGGRIWDIAPGEPDESVMVYRIESTEPDVKMPELPSQLSDREGVALIRQWIADMPVQDCADFEP